MRPALFGLAVLAACSALENAPFSGELVPFPGGFLVTNTGGLEIGFGRAGPGALQAMVRVKGQPATLVGTNCKIAAWPDGLQAHFNPHFAGWRQGTRAAGALC